MQDVCHCVDVASDLNISNFEEVETSKHIAYDSDRYIDIVNTMKTENMSVSDFNTFLLSCNKSIIDEIEVRTKGQHDNPIWVAARTGRVTASMFHDIKTKNKIIVFIKFWMKANHLTIQQNSFSTNTYIQNSRI